MESNMDFVSCLGHYFCSILRRLGIFHFANWTSNILERCFEFWHQEKWFYIGSSISLHGDYASCCWTSCWLRSDKRLVDNSRSSEIFQLNSLRCSNDLHAFGCFLAASHNKCRFHHNWRSFGCFCLFELLCELFGHCAKFCWNTHGNMQFILNSRWNY